MEKDTKKKNGSSDEPKKNRTLTGEPATAVEVEPNIMEQRKRVAVMSFNEFLRNTEK